MIRASIDLGTNTCLLLIADWDTQKDQLSQIVGDYSTVVRLGEGVDHNRTLQPVPMERVIQCLKGYAEKVHAAGVSPEQAICVATSQARDSKNSIEFFNRVQKETGFRFRTLTGNEEAKYTFVGALLPGLDTFRTAVIDIGGGSTEITTSSWARSVDIGSVRLTERYLKTDPVTEAEFDLCLKKIDEPLRVFESYVKQNTKPYELLAVAGTATSLAAWHLNLSEFDAAKIDASFLRKEDVYRMMNELKGMTLEQAQKLPLMDPMRADVILAGSMILWRAMDKLGFDRCRVSTRGLRFGVLRSAL